MVQLGLRQSGQVLPLDQSDRDVAAVSVGNWVSQALHEVRLLLVEARSLPEVVVELEPGHPI